MPRSASSGSAADPAAPTRSPAMLARTLVYLYVLTLALSYVLADPMLPLAIAP